MKCCRGYLLLPASLALALTAAVAFLLAQDSGLRFAQATGRLQADAARGLAEAGLAHLQWKLNQANCSGYADIASSSLGDGSYAATVLPKEGSPVTLSASATLPDGSQAQLVRRDRVVYGPPLSRTLQPDAAAGADTYVDKSGSNRNFGADTVLWVSPDWDNALLRFDLGSIPQGSVIRSAVLKLKVLATPAGGGGAITVHRALRSWSEGTMSGTGTADGATWMTRDGSVAWASVGGDHESAPSASRLVSSAGWQGWEIGALVQEWVSGHVANDGLMVKSGATTVKFASSDSTDSADRPTLEIAFSVPCGTPAPVTTVTLYPAADAELNAPSPTRNFGASPEIWVSLGADATSSVHRIPIRFDVASITAGSKLSSAKLRMYALDLALTQDADIDVHGLSEAWDEGTKKGTGPANGVSWDERTTGNPWLTPGGTVTAAKVATTMITGATTPGWIEFDVTALVQEWVDGITVNNGMRLSTPTTSTTIKFASKEWGSDQPELVVSYR